MWDTMWCWGCNVMWTGRRAARDVDAKSQRFPGVKTFDQSYRDSATANSAKRVAADHRCKEWFRRHTPCSLPGSAKAPYIIHLVRRFAFDELSKTRDCTIITIPLKYGHGGGGPDVLYKPVKDTLLLGDHFQSTKLPFTAIHEPIINILQHLMIITSKSSENYLFPLGELRSAPLN